MKLEKVIIIDFEARHSQFIARKVREHHVYSEILPSNTPVDKIKELSPKGLIFVGLANQDPTQIFKIQQEIFGLAIPILAIGYGLDSGKQELKILREYNAEALLDFLLNQCGCKQEWNMELFASYAIQTIKQQVGDNQVICGLSGGLDSSVAAVLVHRAIGAQLTCIYVDHGFMRKNETEQVVSTFSKDFNMKLIHADASEIFMKKMAGIMEPEEKRKIIGTQFIRVFQEEADKIGDANFLVQGTLYSDVIESKSSQGVVIKSHHNVGGLPEDIEFELVEPLRTLFKDEVRELAKVLGLPEEIVWRHPFPGPGLAIRIIGEVTGERLSILREADAIYLDEIRKAGLYKEIWQAFTVLTNTRTVGVMEGQRTYEYVVAIRAVTSEDAMSAEWSRIPYDVLDRISNRIIHEVQGVNRVVYDISSKPPATIEWE